jgi:hypothetical protein
MKQILFALLLSIAFITTANAGILYRCTDSNGSDVLTSIPQEGMTNCVSMDSAGPDADSDRLPNTEGYKRSGCEVINYSPYDVDTGRGYSIDNRAMIGPSVIGGVYSRNIKHTCMDITIRNNGNVERTITEKDIVVITKKGNKVSPKGFRATIKPRGTHNVTICFSVGISSVDEIQCF